MTAAASPASPTRPSSRLRGLSYLRTYTVSHLQAHSPHAEALPSSNRSTSPFNTQYFTTTSTQPESRAPATPARIESGENGWHPSIQGTLRPTTTTTPASPTSTSTERRSLAATMMTRNRAVTAVGVGPPPSSVHPPHRRHPALEASTPESHAMAGPSTSTAGPNKDVPTIRFIPHVETRSSRPSLHFSALSRTLKTPNSVVKVGRYSERDIIKDEPNTLPVGFKSKVVSRRHCEFWCTDGQWYIKDVKSSSGTFLNHVRLSSPGVESRPYPVNDGDVVQLGIDFKGGEEVIFRCVKIRVECNRGWQKSLNTFNTSAHKRLIKNALGTKKRDSDTASVSSSECSICLNAVAPCQALFVAPCSHVWHYKCVRNLIQSPQWPNFVCPNCRFVADLEADVEQPEDNDLDLEEASDNVPPLVEASGSSDDSGGHDQEPNPAEHARNNLQPRVGSSSRLADSSDDDLAVLFGQTALSPTFPRSQTPRQQDLDSLGSMPIRIAQPTPVTRVVSDPLGARSMTPTSHTQFALAAGPITEGPLTPRNDAGPFILDGSGGRGRADSEILLSAMNDGNLPSRKD